ncbi:MAG: hypothetical protein JXB30_15640 [Anaerolineae bacterium]|nr:hypothetical protein [Anaerolineae bacterium]
MTNIIRDSRIYLIILALLLILGLSLSAPVSVALGAEQAQSDPATQGTAQVFCNIRGAEETDSVACRVSIDGVSQPQDILPGQSVSYSLDLGLHEILVELAGDQAGLWGPDSQQRTVNISAGYNYRVYMTFYKKAHLTIALSQPDIVGDFYVDGELLATQVASIDLWVTSRTRHDIAIKDITDLAAGDAYYWRDTLAYVWPYSGQEKTVVLYPRKVYLKGFLKLDCDVSNVQPEDDVVCNVAIDDQPAGTVPGGAEGQFSLSSGQHTVAVTLSGPDADKWNPSAKPQTVWISLGRTRTATFKFALLPYRYSVMLTGVGDNTRAIYRRGRSLGNRKDVFVKVGDCDTASPYFLHPFDDGVYNLGDYNHLQEAIDYFSGSFGRDSFAANGGFVTAALLNPMWANPEFCKPGESPVACEYRIQKPSIALIMTRTYHYGDNWQENYYQDLKTLVEYSIQQGVIPVLSTVPRIPRAHNAIYEMNDRVKLVAAEYDVPLWDVFETTNALPNNGVEYDTAHLTLPPDAMTGFFVEPNLQYGMTLRNLEALEVLHWLMNEVIY